MKISVLEMFKQAPFNTIMIFTLPFIYDFYIENLGFIGIVGDILIGWLMGAVLGALAADIMNKEGVFEPLFNMNLFFYIKACISIMIATYFITFLSIPIISMSSSLIDFTSAEGASSYLIASLLVVYVEMFVSYISAEVGVASVTDATFKFGVTLDFLKENWYIPIIMGLSVFFLQSGAVELGAILLYFLVFYTYYITLKAYASAISRRDLAPRQYKADYNKTLSYK